MAGAVKGAGRRYGHTFWDVTRGPAPPGGLPASRRAPALVHPHLFELLWVRLPDGAPALTPGHAALLPELLAHLARQP